MNDAQEDPIPRGAIWLRRRLDSSKTGQTIRACAVLTFWLLVGYLSWHIRDLTAMAVTFGVVTYGLIKAWQILPISADTRARWRREEEIAKECPLSDGRFLLWYGLTFSAFQVKREGFLNVISSSDLIFPGVLIVIGGICTIVCRIYVRRTVSESTRKSAQG